MRLSEWEKNLLPLSLVTTKRQAERILRRNRYLMRAAREHRIYSGSTGCPHCTYQNRKNCGLRCPWKMVGGYLRSGSHCLSVELDGVSYFGTSAVEYNSNSERLTRAHTDDASVIYLKAHILWARRMIDGTYKEYAKKEGIEKPEKVDGVWRYEL